MTAKCFTVLYEKYKDKIYQYSLNLTNDSEVSKDIVQDIFMRLWQRKDEYHLINNVEAYLMQMTRNEGLSRKKRLFYKMEYVNFCLSNDETINNHDPVIFKEITTIFIEALNTLPPGEKKVYIARMHGFGRLDIARRTKVSKFTIARQLTLASKKVRKHVKHRLPYPLKEAA